MIYFDLECHLGTLYKIEAFALEGGIIQDNFSMITDAKRPDVVRKIKGITIKQSQTGADERQTILAFWDFLLRNHAVAPQQIILNGIAYYKISCIGFGVCRDLQKIFHRYDIHITYDKNKEFCGDLYEFAKNYCNHLPVESFRQNILKHYFLIRETGLSALPLLQKKLVKETTRSLTKKECIRLSARLMILTKKGKELSLCCERISQDLFRILSVDEKLFADTLSVMFERTKNNFYADDDWRRILARIEKFVRANNNGQLLQAFEAALSVQIQEIYPLSLSYKILDGKGRIGANLIEICYRKTRLLVECGTELEHSVYGEEIRKKVLKSHYRACLISHYHADHAGLIDKIIKRTTVYIGATAKRILQITNKKQYNYVHMFDGAFEIDGISIIPYLCDHSAIDSYMLRFSVAGKSILYTGDFRSHGRKSFSALLSRLQQSDVLICEHTKDNRMRAFSEAQLQAKFEELMYSERDLYVFARTTNIDRIVTIYKACRKTGRILLLDYTQARILNAIGGSIPHPHSHKGIKVVRLTKSQTFTNTSSYVLLIRTSMTDWLDMLLDQRKNAAMIYSMWSGYRKKDDVKRLIGVFEQRNCPTYTLHTSGHADSNAIAQLVNTVAPKEIVYVHGET